MSTGKTNQDEKYPKISKNAIPNASAKIQIQVVFKAKKRPSSSSGFSSTIISSFSAAITNLSVSAFSDSLGPRELRLSGENVNLLKIEKTASCKQKTTTGSSILHQMKMKVNTFHTQLGAKRKRTAFFTFV